MVYPAILGGSWDLVSGVRSTSIGVISNYNCTYLEGSGELLRIASTWRIMGLSNWGYISKVPTVIMTYKPN